MFSNGMNSISRLKKFILMANKKRERCGYFRVVLFFLFHTGNPMKIFQKYETKV